MPTLRTVRRLRAKVAAKVEAERRAVRPHNPADIARYRLDPVGYAVDVLKITPTPDQAIVARACIEPPYRVMVKSGHNIGKSLLTAWLVNWWYDTRDPSVVITTAPTKKSVEDIVWAEIRLLRMRAGLPDHFIGPSAPEMKTHPDHYAKGITASTGEAFQGRHRKDQFFAFDEAEGIDHVYWQVAGTMFQPDGTNLWLATLNPTTTTSQSYQEERAVGVNGERKWRVFSLSSLDHPNIAAQLAGLPPPIPTAVTVHQVNDWLGDWFEPVALEDVNRETDVEFPPGSGQWHRPGPEGESRVLGRRPSAGTFGVWSERLWQLATLRTPAQPHAADLPEIGCDVARFGDDRTDEHERCGPCSLHHESHGGWDTVRIANRLMERADFLAAWITARRDRNSQPIEGKRIRIKVDDTGVGGGVTDILRSKGYNAVAVNAGETASVSEKYPRCRDELWFVVAERARKGNLDLTRIPAKQLARLESQALAPTWKPTVDRKRQVERKEETKKRIGRSPDGMDAVNLAYYEGGQSIAVPHFVDTRDGRGEGRGFDRMANRDRG